MIDQRFVQHIAALTLVVTIGTNAGAQLEISEVSKITASNAASWDEFGASVAMSDDVAIVGMTRDSDSRAADHGHGLAYIYRYDGANWIEEAILDSPDAQLSSRFGHSVAIDGNVAIVGAPYSYELHPDWPGCDSGSAFIFRFDGTNWVQEAKLLLSQSVCETRFGWSVSVQGDTALIGAIGGQAGGFAQLFQYDGNDWVEGKRLVASDAESGDEFGFSVAFDGSGDGSAIVVGAPGDDFQNINNSRGSAYVFRQVGGSWLQTAKLATSDSQDGDKLGSSVAMNGGVIAIGAPGRYRLGNSSGAVYIFRETDGEWVETAELMPAVSTHFDYFGGKVAIEEGLMLIGARGADFECPSHNQTCSTGSAYVFLFDGVEWVEQARLFSSDATYGHALGQCVALKGGIALVGARENNRYPLYDVGSVYTFAGMADCNQNGELDYSEILSGSTSDDDGNWVPDSCECDGDWNGDDVVDSRDVIAYILDYAASIEGRPTTYGSPDIRAPFGILNTADFGAFLNEYNECLP